VTAVEVHHVVDGPSDAPVLLMVNSLGSTLDMWRPQTEALAGRFRVVRFDLRGHGRSPVPPGPYTLDDLGGDALALLDRLGVRRASVCGLSLGGMIAMWLASRFPERVDRLVLCCTSALLGPASGWADRARTVLAGGTGAVADAVVGRWVTAGYAARHPARVRELREMIAATPAAGYAACCGVIERLDLRDSLASITAPTLVIAGADDPATPPPHAEAVAAGIPGARLRIVADAAHLANVEQPATVTGLILDHLRLEES
jgi:3-oxoadipate enol-lactonase